MTTAELKTLWEPGAQGKVMRWSQVRKGWPDREIHLFGAGVDSGTFDYFTEAINGKEKASRGDFTSSEDDNVLVQGVGGDELALGFIPLAYVEQNKERAEVRAGGRRQGGERRRSDHGIRRDRAERDVPAAVAPAVHLRRPQGRRSARRSRSSSSRTSLNPN